MESAFGFLGLGSYVVFWFGGIWASRAKVAGFGVLALSGLEFRA